jgi:hypothetical protein
LPADLLVAMTQSAQDLSPEEPPREGDHEGALQKQKAEGLASSNAAKAKKNLRKAAHTMRSFVHGFKSLSARKSFPGDAECVPRES